MLTYRADRPLVDENTREIPSQEETGEMMADRKGLDILTQPGQKSNKRQFSSSPGQAVSDSLLSIDLPVKQNAPNDRQVVRLVAEISVFKEELAELPAIKQQLTVVLQDLAA
jgi:hypothetical protein